MRRLSVGLCGLFGLFAAAPFGCGGGDGPAAVTCPKVAETCPSPVPSYAAEVAPIIASYCTPCHSPTGVEPSKPYLTYADLKKVQIDILLQVRGCKMPKPGAPPLSEEQMTTLLGWLYCDGPNN